MPSQENNFVFRINIDNLQLLVVLQHLLQLVHSKSLDALLIDHLQDFAHFCRLVALSCEYFPDLVHNLRENIVLLLHARLSSVLFLVALGFSKGSD